MCPIRVTKERSPINLLFERQIQLVPSQAVLGSEGKILLGFGATLRMPRGLGEPSKSPGGHIKDWFPSDSTIVLGEVDLAVSASSETIGQWIVPVDGSILNSTEGGHLVIACHRGYGGLHSLVQGSIARVFLNDSSIDWIQLKHKPPDHDDFFYRMQAPIPSEILKFWPISDCKTVYSWMITKADLRTGDQVVRVNLSSLVNWDIDYIVLMLRRDTLVFRNWIFFISGLLVGSLVPIVVNALVGNILK